LRENRPGNLLNAAFEILPKADMTPREAYKRLVADEVEAVPVDKLANRIAANAVMPYPLGIPMLMSGETSVVSTRRRSDICAACRIGSNSSQGSGGDRRCRA
jgi:arginine/lysine/ornithine decarboxylase